MAYRRLFENLVAEALEAMWASEAFIFAEHIQVIDGELSKRGKYKNKGGAKESGDKGNGKKRIL